MCSRVALTSGIVTALGRTVPEGEGGAITFNVIQMDAAINPGNSGGAVVDLQGDLVGIPTLTIVNASFNTPARGGRFLYSREPRGVDCATAHPVREGLGC